MNLLEKEEAETASSRNDPAKLQEIKQSVSKLERRILSSAKQHIERCLPSYSADVASSTGRVRRRFGTVFRELNSCFHGQREFSRRIYDDKLIFDSVVAKFGHAVPELKWIVDNTCILTPANSQLHETSEAVGKILQGQYFAKHRGGLGGEGSFLIKNGSIIFANGINKKVSPEDFIRIIGESKSQYLLQNVVQQSKEMSALNSSSLNTVRCLSYLDRTGRAHIVGATLRIGVGSSIVDNASSGGLFCGIDIHRGVLVGNAMNKKGEIFAIHPTSGLRFEEYEIPNLQGVFRACTKSHEGIGHPMTVGWDVAITSDAPVIVEGNTRWMAKLHHKVDQRVSTRIWSLYLDDWGNVDIGFDRFGLHGQENLSARWVKVHLLVQGKVQGVGYRHWVANIARIRELSGSVQNLSDGTVEIFLSGPIRRVESSLLNMAVGPMRSNITGIDLRDVKILPESRFSIKRNV